MLLMSGEAAAVNTTHFTARDLTCSKPFFIVGQRGSNEPHCLTIAV